MGELVKVLVVDDHALFRRGLMAILGSEKQLKVVGEASNGEEAIHKTEELQPDVILMDVRMPSCDGLEATKSIRDKGFAGGILMLTVSESDDDLFAAVKTGANGYLLKNAEPEELTQAITHIARGETIISPVMATKLLKEFNLLVGKRAQPADMVQTGLSKREIEILTLVAKGAANSEIASALFIAENTVKTHMRHIMEKLHFKNRSGLAAYAVQSGLLPLEEALKDAV